MKDVKVPTSVSYQEHLISSLKDNLEAAAYIETFFELDEDGYDAKLLSNAIKNVVEARKQSGNISEAAQKHYEQLDNILASTGGAEILQLIEFLDALGYNLSVVAKD